MALELVQRSCGTDLSKMGKWSRMSDKIKASTSSGLDVARSNLYSRPALISLLGVLRLRLLSLKLDRCDAEMASIWANGGVSRAICLALKY